MKRLKTAILTVLAATAARTAFAAFEEKGAGARAPGLGNAFAAIADDVYAVHYNPAGLALLERPELGTGYSRMFMGLSDNSNLTNSFLGYAHPLRGGEWGTAAGSWEQFSLNGGLYQEQAFSLGYGRLLSRKWGPGLLYGGATGKYLRRSFGSFPEADNALIGNGLQVGAGVGDPVLQGRKGMGVPDADLGLLYRLPRFYSFGLQLGNALQPNVAFSDADEDRLPMALRFAMAYRTVLSAVTAQVETRRSPLGGQDLGFTIAAERWFPRLFTGDFAFRGALSNGSRDLRQASLGLSWKTRRIGIDYSFALPITGVQGTQGSHRMSLSTRFGSMSEQDESVELILEAMRKLKAGIVPELRALGPGLLPSQKLLLDEHVAGARSLQARAQYQQALEKLSQALTLSPADTELLKAYGRLNFVAKHIPQLPEYKTDPVHASLHQGIMAYLATNDQEAVEKVSYALSLKPSHAGLDGFLTQLELATGLKRVVVKTQADYWLEEQLTRAGVAVEEGRYREALALSLEVLKKDSGSVPAWENIGTAYFALADYPRAQKSWQKVYSLESNPTRRSAARGYIKAIERLMKKRAEARRPEAPGPEGVAPPPKPVVPQVPAEELEKLYNDGIDLYTGGRLEEAQRAFEQVLTLDPNHVPAAKALRRVQDELRNR